MPVMFQWRYTDADLEFNPEAYYVFGDNDHRAGHGGQAKVCRNHNNVIGGKLRPHKRK